MKKKLYIIAGNPEQAIRWITNNKMPQISCKIVNFERDLLLAERRSLFIKTGTFYERNDLEILEVYLMAKDMIEAKQI